MAVKTRAVLKAENAADFPDNGAHLISPAKLRGQMDDVVDSAVFPEDAGFGGSGAVDPRAYGLVADGASHPLSAEYATLAAAQADYPFATSLAQEIDYCACKAASNAAFGADGAEHGTDAKLNMPLWLPQGSYWFGNDTWTIRNLVGGRIEGAGERATELRGNKAVLQFDGLWYTELSNFSVLCATANVDETAALDIDGNVPGHPYATRGVQGVTLRNMLIDGGGSKYAFTMCRLGGAGGQGSECQFLKVHLSNASFACYYQNGFNALANTFVGGNFQAYPKYGAYIVGGDAHFYTTGFQSTYGYRQIENAGADIRCGDAGAYQGLVIHGCRTESLVFLYNAGAIRTDVRACVGNVALSQWFASTPYGPAAPLYKAIYVVSSSADIGNRLFVATTPGTSGTVEPNWNAVAAGGTIADGTVVWIETPFNAIYNLNGSVDVRTVVMSVGNIVAAPYANSIRTFISSASEISTVLRPDENGLCIDTTNTAGGTVTVTAPNLAYAAQFGREFFVKKTDTSANTVTVNFLPNPYEHAGSPAVIPGGSRGYKRFVYAQGTGTANSWFDVT